MDTPELANAPQTEEQKTLAANKATIQSMLGDEVDVVEDEVKTLAARVKPYFVWVALGFGLLLGYIMGHVHS